MRGTGTIFRRELGAYFNSPIAYVVVSTYILLTAYLFFQILFLQGQAELRFMFEGFWPPLLLAIVAPALSMRLLAEERSNDTLETLLTMPVTDGGVVLGKYLAALTLFVFAMVFLFVFGGIVTVLGPLDKSAALAGYLGLFLLAALFIAIGLMTSSFGKNQVVSLILAVLICLLFWLFGKTVAFLPASVQPVVTWLGIDSHMENFAKGVIDTRDVLYFVTFSGACLLVTHASLESRRWR